MHELLRKLCLREAKKDKFLGTTRLLSFDNFPQDINVQRRIAIHRPTIFEKETDIDLPPIRNAFQCAPLARSLICISPKILPYANFRLSRVLKAHDRRGQRNHSVENPFHLVSLRCIIFFSNETSRSFYTIPSSMYLLWNLQTLIVDHFITSNVDIWKMHLFRHVKFMRLYLNNLKEDDFILENLQTLSNVENFKCGKKVVKRIPHIRKLKFIHNSGAFKASHYRLNNLYHLHKLESLKCDFSSERSWHGLVQNLRFPHSLKKLTLFGCRLHWKDMPTKLGSLPHLPVLNLGLNSFIGPKWETVEGQFLSLKFLKVESYKELECWTTEASHFEHLLLNNLWSLKEIPSDLENISTLKLIEVACCNKAIMLSAKEIAGEQGDIGNQDLQVRVRKAHMPYEELKKMASCNFLVDE